MSSRLCLFALGIVFVCGCSTEVDSAAMKQFADAESQFASAKTPQDFLEAAIAYQAILDRGIESATVYYNQGNAFMNAEERGRAIASFRRGERLQPGDPLLQANLQTALGEVSSAGNKSFVDMLFFWQNWIGYPTKFLVTTICLSLLVMFGMLASLLRNSPCKSIAWGLAAITVVAALSTGWDWYRFDVSQSGVVVESAMPRKGNSEKYEPSFTKPLPDGTEFTVAEQRGDWYLIDVPAVGSGWLQSDAVVIY